MVGSVVLAAALVGLVGPIVRLISTPEEAVAGTTVYLTICFIGIPCITAYNVLASIFRGMGDSRSPMYFIAAACVVNIGLDFFFMGALRLGPAGAALGTTLSQAVSVLLALCVILKRRSIRLSKSDFCPRKATMKDILSIGLPVAAQDGFIQVSFMLITIMANQRGLTDAAAVGIVEKIISFLFLVPSSMLSTVSALGAQNIGAGKYDRVDKILRYAIAIGVGFGAVMALLMQFIAPSVVRPFTSDEAVVKAGAAYIRSYIFDCLLAGIQFSFSGYFCAWGRSGLSYLHNTLSILLVRVPGAWLACRFFPQTLVPMGLAPACGALFSLLLSFASINLRADQTIGGTALNLMAPALVLFFIRIIANQNTLQMITGDAASWFMIKKSTLGIDKNTDLGFFGETFVNKVYLATYVCILLFLILSILLYKTRFGLRLRACGENPQAADSLGINVYKMRYAGVLLSGALGAIGGLAYIVPPVQTWNFEVGVAGAGFLALAVMIFGQWKPFNICAAAMFFAVFKSLANIADSTFLAQLHWSSNIYNMMPFIASMIILAFTSKNSMAPKAEGIPYDKGSR